MKPIREFCGAITFLTASALGVAFSLSPACGADGNVAPPASEVRPGSFHELLDLRSIAALKPWQTRQQSSRDPAGGFYDSGHFVRIEDDRHLVLLDEEGPGCIDRLWFTRKRPWDEPYELLIFVDSQDEPVARSDLDALFAGNRPPFAAPLVGRCGLERTPGLYCYVPIGFRRRCKVVLVPTVPDDQYQWRTDASGERVRHVYYQITYRHLTRSEDVRVFHSRLDFDEAQAFEKVGRLWNSAGASPWGSIALSSTSRTVEIAPGSSTDFFQVSGPGVVYELHMAVEYTNSDPPTHTADTGLLELEATWDDAARPQVSAPLGVFFVSPTQQSEVRGLWTGCRNGAFYMFMPMPFADSARLAVRNRTSHSVTVEATVKHRSEGLREGDGRLCTYRYDISSPQAGQDYAAFEHQGTGQVVGIVMDRPGNMEGDDRWFIDGATTPTIHGTGTEDFFNFAWGLAANQSFALHGMTRASGGPLCYRFLSPGAVPFEKSLRLTWEHGHHPTDGPNRHSGQYSGLVFYYTRP